MRSILPLVSLALLVVSCSCANNKVQLVVDPDDRERFDKGMEIGEKLAEFFKEGNFNELLTNVGAMGGPILGAVTSLISLFLSFFTKPTESPELKYMKKKFKEVNTKLDRMFDKFDEVKNLIKWSSVELSYVHHEQKILNMEYLFNRLLAANETDVKTYLRMELIRTYEQSALTLYRAFVDNDQVLSKNVVVAAMDHMKNDRGKIRSFMTGFTQLIIRGSKLDIAYTRLAYPNNTAAAEDLVKSWESKLQILQTRLGQFDERVKANLQLQGNRDIDVIVREADGKSNQQLSIDLYHHFAHKYYWINWFVLVFGDDKMVPQRDFSEISCFGFKRFKFYGRNIIISMSDPIGSDFNHYNAMSLFNYFAAHLKAPDNKPTTWLDIIERHTGRRPCSAVPRRFVARIAVCVGCVVSWQAPAGRLAHKLLTVRQGKGRIHLFLFG